MIILTMHEATNPYLCLSNEEQYVLPCTCRVGKGALSIPTFVLIRSQEVVQTYM